jgi:hypothetical protein
MTCLLARFVSLIAFILLEYIFWGMSEERGTPVLY